MNYLGHLFFSNDDFDLMICNLYGDFVKGSKFNHYPKKIQKGIKLHRAIDSYIDAHPKIKELKSHLYSPLPRVSGIAIDLYLDHFLAKNWSHFHAVDYQSFLTEFFEYRSTLESEMKMEFQTFLIRMRKYKWLEHYPSFYGLTKLCEGVSSKLSFENELKNAPALYYKMEKQIEETFLDFLREAQDYFNGLD